MWSLFPTYASRPYFAPAREGELSPRCASQARTRGDRPERFRAGRGRDHRWNVPRHRKAYGHCGRFRPRGRRGGPNRGRASVPSHARAVGPARPVLTRARELVRLSLTTLSFVAYPPDPVV